jgi:hypothetical protein
MGFGNGIDNGQPKSDALIPGRSLAKRYTWTGIYDLNHRLDPFG